MTKIMQNTFKRVDFPHPLGPISIQNYPQGMQIEQSLRTSTSCVCLFPLKNQNNQNLKLERNLFEKMSNYIFHSLHPYLGHILIKILILKIKIHHSLNQPTHFTKVKNKLLILQK